MRRRLQSVGSRLPVGDVVVAFAALFMTRARKHPSTFAAKIVHAVSLS